MQTFPTASFSPRYVMSPDKSTKKSASGTKNECEVDICVRFSSRQENFSGQNKQSRGESRVRAAAIFSSMVCEICSSVASGEIVKAGLGGSTAFRSGCFSSVFVSDAVSEGSPDARDSRLFDTAFNSFSLCFFEFMCDR